MDEKPIDPYYKRLANDLTNVLHDKGFLAPDLSRQSVDQLEEYIGFLFQSHCDMTVRAAGLIKKARQIKQSSGTEAAADKERIDL